MPHKHIRLFFAAACLCFGTTCTFAALYAPATNYPTGNNPIGLCLGDLRGNKKFRDMAVANYGDNTVGVRLCLDDGTFGHLDTYAVDLNPSSVRSGDLNRDGLDDLVTANFGTNTVSVLVNLGGGANFRAATNYLIGTISNPGPKDLAVADVNRDGKLDLVVANYSESSVSILYGLGGGAFGGPTNNYSVGAGPSSVIVADLNGDTFPDAVTANTIAGTLTILPGQANGTFGAAQTITLYPGGDPQPVYLLSGDFNGDTTLDLVTANYNSNTVSILIGDATGGGWVVGSQDEYVVGIGPRSLGVRELNRDGLLDIAVVNSGDDNVEVLFGLGNGTFVDQGTFAVGDNPAILTGSNFNTDNATDLAVANSGDNTVSVLLFAGPLAYNVQATVNEDTPKQLTLSGSLLGGGSLLFVTNSLPTHGMLTATNLSATNLVYSPDADYFGPDSFTYVTTDGTLTSAVATVTINVLPVNDQPSFSLNAASATVYEDAATTNIANFAGTFVKGPANESSQSFTFVVTTTNKSFFATQPAISPLGTLTFRAALNATGIVTVLAQMKDSGGTLRGGGNLSAAHAFTITVLPNPLKPAKGLYNGLFYESGGVQHASSGFFSFTVTANGVFSGKLIGDGGKYTFAGNFNLAGHATVEVLRNGPTLTLNLQLDLTSGTDQVTGTVSDGVWTAALLGDRAVFNARTNPAPQMGRYTFAIPGNNNPTNSPGGDGYGLVTVASNGLVRASGKLGDGTSFSQAVYLSKNGQWPFYIPLFSGRGSVLSWITFTNRPSSSLEGDLTWIKPFSSTAKYYPNAYTNFTSVLGSTYASPPPATPVLSLTSCLLVFRGGNLATAATNNATLGTDNIVFVGLTPILSLSSPTTGLMSGNFFHPTINSSRGLKAIVLQQQNVARGFFLGTNQTGSVLLQSP